MADGSIHIDTKLDSSSLKPQLNSMTKSFSSAFASMRDIMLGPVLAAKAVGNALKSIGDATIGQAAKIEDMVAAFTPMVGGAENAKKMIAALNKEAATTPFELEGIGSVAKQLLPVLGNDVQKVTKTFRMLGDTAGGNIQKLDTITRGYMKSMLKDKVDMESLNMIAEAGVPIYSELASSMGITTAQMMDMSSKGKITSADLTKAFEKMTGAGGIFANGMDLASQTLSGKLSTLSDNFKQAGASIGNAFLPVTKHIVDALSGIALGFKDFFDIVTDNRTAYQKHVDLMRDNSNAATQIIGPIEGVGNGHKLTAEQIEKLVKLYPDLSGTMSENNTTQKEALDLINQRNTAELRNLSILEKSKQASLIMIKSELNDNLAQLGLTYEQAKAIDDLSAAMERQRSLYKKGATTKQEVTKSENAYMAALKAAGLAGGGSSMAIHALTQSIEENDSELKESLKNMSEYDRAITNLSKSPIVFGAKPTTTEAPAKSISIAIETNKEREALEKLWADKLLDQQNDTLEKQRDAYSFGVRYFGVALFFKRVILLVKELVSPKFF